MFRAFSGLVAFLLLAMTEPVAADRRVALVIGNASYEHAAALTNPLNDADDIAAKLETLDFEVVKGSDLDLNDMRRIVRDFIGQLEGADVALFYYAGHGLQVNGKNYVVPIDAQLRSENDLDFETMPISLVLSAMERLTKTNLVFLDACRNNPLARNLAQSMGTRSASVGRGLARIGSGVGTLVSFSTQPGNVALDGTGRNSPFTAALVKNLGLPGEDITKSLVRVRVRVLKETAGRQIPWENSSLTGEVILKATPTPDPLAPSEIQVELAYWNSIKDSADADFFESYLAQYPNGKFASLARLNLEKLKRSEADQQKTPATDHAEMENGTANQQIAALTPEEDNQPADKEPDNRLLVRSVQTELNRLGCAAGNADGVWGRKSRQALDNYAKHSGTTVASLDPSSDLLEALRNKKTRVCPASRASEFNGRWNFVQFEGPNCGWEEPVFRTTLLIRDGVIGNGRDWKGTISDSGEIRLKNFFFQNGRTESESYTGRIEESSGKGTFRHDQGNCRGRFTISR